MTYQSCEICNNFGNCGCDDLREREYLHREGKDCYKPKVDSNEVRLMNINKEVIMITKTKFQDIKEELNRNYYKVNNWTDKQTDTYNNRFDALKNAVDKLLTLLDEAVS